MYIVYILTSIADPKRTHVGHTSNLTQRLKQHNAKKIAGYNNHHAPWQVETYVTFSQKKLALQFERSLKTGSGFAFMKRHLLP